MDADVAINPEVDKNLDRSSFYRNLTGNLDAGKPLTWANLKGLMRFSERSEKGKELGLWSFEVLEQVLGEDWLSPTKTKDSGVDSIFYWADYRHDFFLEIVELALTLDDFKNVDGYAKVRRDLKNDATLDRFWHSRAVCQLGRQALMAGHQIAFEKKIKESSSPVDLVISSNDALELCCEVFCIFRSESTINEFERSDRISNNIERIASTERVTFDGQWKSMPDDATLQSLFEQIQELAETVGRTGETHKLDNVYIDATISPSNGRLGGLGNYCGPMVQGEGLERVLKKLRGKINQAHSSRATWVYMEVNDDLWQFTTWAREPLGKKLEIISPWLVELIRELNWCHGIILTSGVTTALLLHTDETVKSPDGSYALRRYFAPGSLRVRESIIIPASLDVSEECRAWFELLANERDWLEWALRQHGLPKIDELLSSTPI
jgi:hypothetical protein